MNPETKSMGKTSEEWSLLFFLVKGWCQKYQEDKAHRIVQALAKRRNGSKGIEPLRHRLNPFL